MRIVGDNMQKAVFQEVTMKKTKIICTMGPNEDNRQVTIEADIG